MAPKNAASEKVEDGPLMPLFSNEPTGLPEWGENGWLVERDIVNLVGNAHYDVSRYPGHVARMTNGVGAATKAKRQFLGRTMRKYSYSRRGWVMRCFVAVIVTCSIPMLAMMFKMPSDCSLKHLLSEYGLDRQAKRGAYEENFVCNMAEHRFLVMGVSVAIGVAPVFMFGLLTLVYATSVAFTNKLYSIHVWVMLQCFHGAQVNVESMLMNTIDKPLEHILLEGCFGTIRNVWKRLFIEPYIVCIWLSLILSFFLLGALWLGEIGWGGITCLWMFQLYFPIIDAILGARTTLQNIIESELRTTHQADSRPTDLWIRLFKERTSSFACTKQEIDLMITYFKDSHEGHTTAYQKVFKRWPIWWHDDLCITGNSAIKEVFIEDLDIVITRHGSETTMAWETREFLNSRHEQIQKMYNERQ